MSGWPAVVKPIAMAREGGWGTAPLMMPRREEDGWGSVHGGACGNVQRAWSPSAKRTRRSHAALVGLGACSAIDLTMPRCVASECRHAGSVACQTESTPSSVPLMTHGPPRARAVTTPSANSSCSVERSPERDESNLSPRTWMWNSEPSGTANTSSSESISCGSEAAGPSVFGAGTLLAALKREASGSPGRQSSAAPLGKATKCVARGVREGKSQICSGASLKINTSRRPEGERRAPIRLTDAPRPSGHASSHRPDGSRSHCTEFFH